MSAKQPCTSNCCNAALPHSYNNPVVGSRLPAHTFLSRLSQKVAMSSAMLAPATWGMERPEASSRGVGRCCIHARSSSPVRTALHASRLAHHALCSVPPHPATHPHVTKYLPRHPPACCRRTRMRPSAPCGTARSCQTSPAGRPCKTWAVNSTGWQRDCHRTRRLIQVGVMRARQAVGRSWPTHCKRVRDPRQATAHLHVFDVLVVQRDHAADELALRPAAAARLLARLACRAHRRHGSCRLGRSCKEECARMCRDGKPATAVTPTEPTAGSAHRVQWGVRCLPLPAPHKSQWLAGAAHPPPGPSPSSSPQPQWSPAPGACLQVARQGWPEASG